MDLCNILNKVIECKDYSNIIKKCWLYKDKVSVLEIEYKRNTFALDFFINKKGLISIDLVDRNTSTVYILSKIKSNKINLINDANIDTLDIIRANLRLKLLKYIIIIA